MVSLFYCFFGGELVVVFEFSGKDCQKRGKTQFSWEGVGGCDPHRNYDISRLIVSDTIIVNFKSVTSVLSGAIHRALAILQLFPIQCFQYGACEEKTNFLSKY